jgi:hypothetical protein
MPKVKIKAAPKSKLRKFQIAGQNNCPAGMSWDAMKQTCVPSIQGGQSAMDATNWGNPTTLSGAPFSASPNLSYKSPTDLSDPGMQAPFDVQADINSQNKQQQNHSNWMKDPRNEMANSGWGQDFYKKSGITAPVYNSNLNYSGATTNNGRSKLGKFNDKVDNFFTAAGIALNYFDQNKKQREYNKWMGESMLPHNQYAVNTHTDRGDYDVNDGMFDPYRMGYKSKGTQANPIGASSSFVRYGGLIKAADGLAVAGDQVLQKAFLPDVSTSVIGPSTQVNTNSQQAVNVPVKSTKSSGANPMAEQTWQDYAKEFKGVTNVGIWGDKRHKARKSDHNTGDALDLGITNLDQGTAVSQKLIQDAATRNIKYIIFNKQIWNPSKGNEWRPYTGDDPHIGHVHISFNRNEQSANKVVDHNNPLNIHYGNFTSQYGAQPGANDNGGRVAKFANLETGIQANKDLLFGPNYVNLSIAEARNKWVSGSTNNYNNSTNDIVQNMGGNKKLSSLSPDERDKLFKLFAKWENKNSYNLIKNKRIFNEGGEPFNTNTNMKIRIVGGPDHMATGGEPKYSGQSDYGLYIGQRNLYKTMAKNPYENASKSVSEKEETEEDPYVLEAEGGETILNPDGTHMNISGDRHSEGGVKLTKSQAPEGSFIYSDTNKMKIKNPKILQHFGKSAKKTGITPAELAKQYDVNRYMSILQDPNADKLSKDTAMKMVENYQRKLAELALVQEGIKGFPNGIPEVAKSVVNNNQQPQMEYGGYYAYGGGPEDPLAPVQPKPVGFGYDINNASGDNPGTYGFTGGINSKILNGKLIGTNYNAGFNFPKLFGKNRGLGITGNYGNKELNLGATAKFNTGKAGVLSLNTGYSKNFDNSQQSSQQDDFMRASAPANKPKGNFNIGADWTGKIGNTNVKLSGYYGKQAYGGNLNKFIAGGGNSPLSVDPFGKKSLLQNAGMYNTTTGEAVVNNSSNTTPTPTVPDWFKPWVKSNTKAGMTSPTGQPTVFDPKNPNPFYIHYDRWKKLNNNKDFSGPEEFQNFIYDYVSQKDPNAVEDMWKYWGTTNKGKKDPKNLKKAFADKFFGKRTAKLAEWEDKSTTPPPVVAAPPADAPPVVTSSKTSAGPSISAVPNVDPVSQQQNAAWTNQDRRDLLNAGLDYATLKKYHGYAPTIQPVLPEFIPTDWRGYAASLQSGANKAAEQMGTYQPGQSMASNLSFLAGQQAGQLGDYISKVDQYNAAGASNMDAQRAQTLNQYTQANAAARKGLWDEENVYDDRYRTAERLGRKGIVKAWNQGEDNASKIYNLNQVESPYYTVDPRTQKIVFNSDAAKAAYIAATKGGPEAGAGARAATELKDIYDNLTFIPEKDRYDAALKIWSGDNNTGKTTSRSYVSKPDKNYTQTTESTDKQP